MAPTRERARARRVLGAIAGAALLAFTFVVALVVGVVLHMSSPAARRVVASEVGVVLASTFQGTIRIDRIDRIGLDGVDVAHVVVLDPDGVEVISVDGVHGRMSVVALARSLLFGKGDIEIVSSFIGVDAGRVNLDSDASGTSRIARAFALRPTPPSATSGAPSRGVAVSLQRIDVARAWVHGIISGVPPIDADASDVRAAVSVVSGHVSVDAYNAKIVTRGFPRDANADGAATAKVDVPSPTGKPFGVVASFAGLVGTIPASARGTLDGDRFDVVADVPEIAAEQPRTLVPEAPVYAPVAAHVEGHGTPSVLDATANVRLGGGTIDATAVITLGNDVGVKGTAAARSLDARSFAPSAVATVLDLSTSTTLTILQDGTVTGDYVLELSRGTVAANVVPRTSIHGAFERRANARGVFDMRVQGQGSVAEAGAPSAVSFDLHPDGKSSIVDFDVRTSIPNLDAVARVGPIGRGRAQLHTKGRLRVPDLVIDATLDGTADDFTRGPLRFARAVVSAHAQGPLSTPSVEGSTTMSGVDANGLKFSRATVDVRGPVKELDVGVTAEGVNAPRVQAHASVAVGDVTTIRAGSLSLSRDDVSAVSTVDSVRITHGDVRVDGVVVKGLGEPVHAELHAMPGTLALRADSKMLDLGRLGRLLRVEKTLIGGQAIFDIDVAVTGSTITGRVLADASQLSLPRVTNATVHVDAIMSGRRVSGHVRAAMASIGYVDVTTVNAELAGSAPISLDSWKQGWGAVQLSAECELAPLWALLPKDSIPLDDVAGKLVLRGHVARASANDTMPELALSATTRGLVVSGGGARARERRTSDVSSWHVSGVDVRVEAKLDGKKNDSELVVRLRDDKGELAAVDARSSAVPYAALLADGSDPVALLMKTPFTANGEVRRRSLDGFRALFDARNTHGDVEASFGFAGTVIAPQLEVLAKAYDVKAPAAPVTMKMSGDATLHYDGTKADADFSVRSPRAVVLSGSVHAVLKMADVLARSAGVDIPWQASGDARAFEFPLGAVSVLSERQVRGKLSGELSFADLHENARAKLRATIADLQLGGAKMTGAMVAAELDESRLRASARLDQTDGYLQASAVLGMKWGRMLLPVRDDASASEASLEARRFRLSALLPFVDGIFSDLDGRLDARVSFGMDGDGKSPRLQGGAALSEGLFQLASMGEEYHGVAAKLSIAPDGSARLDDAVAYGVTGKVTAHATARLAGLSLVDAAGSIRIAKGQALPLEVNGSAVGDVYGDVDVKATMSPDKHLLSVGVDVPVMHLRLPPSTTRSVQQLEEPVHTHIGFYDASHQFHDLPIDGEDLLDVAPPSARTTEIDITVRLGRDIVVERGTSLKVELAGGAVVKVTDKARVSGQIQLKRGTVDVQGKPFEIEKGTITFVGDDPSNPEVLITAGWTAPDGTRVNADFTGTVKTGRVTLRSSPARPNNEILALIMFGTVNGSSATPYAQSTSNTAVASSAAAGAAGGTVTQGLNRAIDSITGLQISTKIDTSSPNPRPEVALQVAKDVSLEVAIVLGTPPPGTNQDLTYLIMEWRFAPRWSLATTFGDKGSSIGDVVWQYRY